MMKRAGLRHVVPALAVYSGAEIYGVMFAYSK